MKTKLISSTKVQNNFGQVIDDVIQNHSRYVIKRRNTPQAILLSLADIRELLASGDDIDQMNNVIQELIPVYELGQTFPEK